MGKLFKVLTAASLIGIFITGCNDINSTNEIADENFINPTGNTNSIQLYLHNRLTGDHVYDAYAWGKIKYSLTEDNLNFIFDGFNLDPDTWFALYSDTKLLGFGITDKEGNINIRNSLSNAEDFNNSNLVLWYANEDGTSKPNHRILRS